MDISYLRAMANAPTVRESAFFQALSGNRLDESHLRIFFVDYYEVVKTSYRMLAASVSRVPSSETELIAYLMRFLETEAGGQPSHLILYHRWAEYFGFPVDSLLAAEAAPAAKAFSRTLMDIYSSGDKVRILAAQLAVEDCAEVLIAGLDDGFRQYGIPHTSYGYLYAHLLLENDIDGHSQWAREVLSTIPSTVPGVEIATNTMLSVTSAFRGVFDGIEQQWNH
jgi:pyrroloquinoline quinone (PQQ) biosynthesis protein C